MALPSGTRKNTTTRSTSGATRRTPRRACARLVTVGVLARPEAAMSDPLGVAPARRLSLLVGGVEVLGDLLSRLLPGQDGLDAVEHRLVEDVGRRDVDVRAEV